MGKYSGELINAYYLLSRFRFIVSFCQKIFPPFHRMRNSAPRVGYIVIILLCFYYDWRCLCISGHVNIYPCAIFESNDHSCLNCVCLIWFYLILYIIIYVSGRIQGACENKKERKKHDFKAITLKLLIRSD